MDKEYSSLRDEIMKWQERRISFSQIGLTLITVYSGYMIGKDVKENSTLSWQLVSLLPLLFLTMTMHVTKLFELFHLRLAAYIAVFYDSVWERNVAEVSFSKGKRVGYNRSMAIVYFLVGCLSVFIFAQRFPGEVFSLQSLPFALCALLFLLVFKEVFYFNTTKEKEKLITRWKKIKHDEAKQHPSASLNTSPDPDIHPLPETALKTPGQTGV